VAVRGILVFSDGCVALSRTVRSHMLRPKQRIGNRRCGCNSLIVLRLAGDVRELSVSLLSLRARRRQRAPLRASLTRTDSSGDRGFRGISRVGLAEKLLGSHQSRRLALAG
jgi:hypothetical protein